MCEHTQYSALYICECHFRISNNLPISSTWRQKNPESRRFEVPPFGTEFDKWFYLAADEHTCMRHVSRVSRVPYSATEFPKSCRRTRCRLFEKRRGALPKPKRRLKYL